jgi:hypothetical protein
MVESEVRSGSGSEKSQTRFKSITLMDCRKKGSPPLPPKQGAPSTRSKPLRRAPVPRSCFAVLFVLSDVAALPLG